MPGRSRKSRVRHTGKPAARSERSAATGDGVGRKHESSQRLRQRIAQLAARLMAEEGVHDFQQAKVKAAARLGAPMNGPNLPRNDEIHRALADYQQLFQADSQPDLLRRLRQLAFKTMEMLTAFHPRLAGSVLVGTATQFSVVTLHLFTEPAERVAWFLIDRGIPFQLESRQYRYPRQRIEDVPVYGFTAESVRVDLVVFPSLGLRQAPTSPVHGRPMQRATKAQLEALIAEDPIVSTK